MNHSSHLQMENQQENDNNNKIMILYSDMIENSEIIYSNQPFEIAIIYNICITEQMYYITVLKVDLFMVSLFSNYYERTKKYFDFTKIMIYCFCLN